MRMIFSPNPFSTKKYSNEVSPFGAKHNKMMSVWDDETSRDANIKYGFPLFSFCLQRIFLMIFFLLLTLKFSQETSRRWHDMIIIMIKRFIILWDETMSQKEWDIRTQWFSHSYFPFYDEKKIPFWKKPRLMVFDLLFSSSYFSHTKTWHLIIIIINCRLWCAMMTCFYAHRDVHMDENEKESHCVNRSWRKSHVHVDEESIERWWWWWAIDMIAVCKIVGGTHNQ